MAAPRGQDIEAGTRGGRFGRMFPDAPPAGTSKPAIDELARWIKKESASQASDNHLIPAGYTYLGQFIDHDITFDPTTKLQQDADPQALVNFRSPRFDLDSLYGSGPDDQPFLYEWTNRADRGVKLLVGQSDEGVLDLPRNDQDVALIGDARNDENLIVSQLHLLFIRFHNAVVEHVRKHGRVAADDVFDTTRQLVRWHYQWIVTHDFLERIVGEKTRRDVLREGPGRGDPANVNRRFFTWTDEPAIPVEFSGAAYRFGHSMVRSDYPIKRGGGSRFILPAEGREPGLTDLGGFRALPADLELEWDLFFWRERIAGVTISSRRINHRISTRLFAVPGRGELPRLNLQRGSALDLPSGQSIADAMTEPKLDADDLPLRGVKSDSVRRELLEATPLWYYILCEAGTKQHGGGGQHLGPVGGRIVAEVLAGLLEGDPSSYLSTDPSWRPMLPSGTSGDFTMMDLVDFALGRSPRPPT